jgi:hypothetical protein
MGMQEEHRRAVCNVVLSFCDVVSLNVGMCISTGSGKVLMFCCSGCTVVGGCAGMIMGGIWGDGTVGRIVGTVGLIGG